MRIPSQTIQWKLGLALCVFGLNVGCAFAQDQVLQNVDLRDLDLHTAMRLLSEQTGKNIVPSAEAGKVKINLLMNNVRLESVLTALAKSNNLLIDDKDQKKDGTILIYSREEKKRQDELRMSMPSIVLRGIVLAKDGKTTVLLDVGHYSAWLKEGDRYQHIGTREFLVRELTSKNETIITGGKISSSETQTTRENPSLGTVSVTLQIVKLTPAEVVIEVLETNDKIILR